MTKPHTMSVSGNPVTCGKPDAMRKAFEEWVTDRTVGPLMNLDWREGGNCYHAPSTHFAFQAYQAGRNDGLEAAAKECYETNRVARHERADEGIAYGEGCHDCAQAIRSLNTSRETADGRRARRRR